MSRSLLMLSVLALGASLPLAASAAQGETIDTCVELSASHSLHRTGSQFLYVKDGSDHYRLSFTGGACGDMAVTNKFRIDTGGANDRICPGETRVVARGRHCQVHAVRRIEGDDFARLTRKRR